MVVCTSRHSDEHNMSCRSTWEDVCRKELTYDEFLVWRNDPAGRKFSGFVVRFFVMFDDCHCRFNESVDDATRMHFEWYIFIGCVCAGLTPLSKDLLYVVDLS